ncbi:unnamed protein product [Adineta ricciae]|uniref:Uncharacterized protein n=1 Tax=Adineta ricciae TaxID=249248 RepID=A0A815FKM0_ADIRI|nr:unnamed protein product [Adineta ricciae]
MRQEVIDAGGECLSKPRQELGLLLDQLDLVHQKVKAFDEIDLSRWKDLVDRVKMLSIFHVTLMDVDNGLELLVTGKKLENLIYSTDNDRHPIGLVPIPSSELQRSDHTGKNAQVDPTENRRLEESRTSTALAEGVEHPNNQRPLTQLRRPAAAEIPFEHRSFYPLRWRINN